MAGKRAATTDLNHDNWNNEDEPEDAGTFTRAPPEVLEKRPTKVAKRRLATSNHGSKPAFGGFTGFKTAPVSSATAFNFLKKIDTTSASITTSDVSSPIFTAGNGASQLSENGVSTMLKLPQVSKNAELEQDPAEKNKIFKKSTDYFAKLKGLNESVSQWIKSHVDSNPICILTPIFRDYERHFKNIEAEHGKEYELVKNKSPEKSTQKTNLNAEASTSNSIFTTNSAPTKSILSHSIFTNTNNDSNNKLDMKTTSFPSTTATFSFGTGTTSSSSAGFSFGSGKPFTFGSSVTTPSSEAKDNEDQEDDEEPPKPEIKVVIEDGAVFEKKCKVFVKKDQATYGDRGVGMLFLKPTPNGKIQLIVRAQNSLGNLLLNTLLTESIPIQRMNKNTIMLMCLPLPDSSPPPNSVLLRVKTSEDADALIEALEKNKK